MGQLSFKIMKHIKCFHCMKSISITDGYFMYPLEIPYCNLFFHRDCFVIANQDNDIIQYLTDKLEAIKKYTRTNFALKID